MGKETGKRDVAGNESQRLFYLWIEKPESSQGNFGRAGVILKHNHRTIPFDRPLLFQGWTGLNSTLDRKSQNE
jgi:hypothetical protein